MQYSSKTLTGFAQLCWECTNSALWRSAISPVEHPILNIARFQHGFDEVDEPMVITFTLQQIDQHLMINPVIEALQPVQVVFRLRLECKCNLSFSKPLVILSVVFQGRHQG